MAWNDGNSVQADKWLCVTWVVKVGHPSIGVEAGSGKLWVVRLYQRIGGQIKEFPSRSSCLSSYIPLYLCCCIDASALRLFWKKRSLSCTTVGRGLIAEWRRKHTV